MPQLPASIDRVRQLDPRLADDVGSAFERLGRASEALVWALEHLDAFVRAGSPDAALQIVVERASELTGAPVVWALRWSGDPERGPISFRGLARAGGGEGIPAPAEISASVVGQVARSGKPAWSDDAASDARFASSQSVVRWSLRSVGCVPLGKSAALYLADPDQPGRFSADQRARLGALGRVAAPFVQRTAESARRGRTVEAVPGLVGDAPAMHELYDAIRAFAPMPWPLLVLGETGSGKEGVARAIHELSGRGAKPFIAINCGAIPENLAESTLFGHERGAFTGADRQQPGTIERVQGGTLFLDEVGELSAAVQVKLLRLLQEGTFERVGGQRTMRFDGRVVAATHRSLDDPEARGAFREDLYYRLAACVIRVPALRERPGDIELLAHHLLERALAELPGRARLDLPQPTVRALERRGWPGNVRDLENAIRGGVARALASRSRSIDPDHLAPERPGARPASGDFVGDLQAATEAFQKERVYAALEAADGNRSQAARMLGVSRQWLHRLLARWEG